MPLIILGIIVVGGALFLVLSTIKPAIGRRLRGGYHGFGFGGFDGFGAVREGAQVDVVQDEEQPSSERADGASMGETKDADGKVLYIFGSGEREERTLGEKDGKDE